MKKIFTLFAAMLLAVGAFAQFGILVNGKMYYAGEENKTPGDPSFKEYMVLGLSMKSGDYCQLCDAGSNYATWTVALDPSSTQSFSLADNKYTVGKDGCYDFYIKIKMNADQLYVGEGQCGSPKGTDISGGQGGGQGGGQQGGGVEGNPRYYYKMYTASDEQWHEPSEYTLFDHGVADMLDYTGDAYVFIIYQVDGKAGEQYRTESFVDSSHRQARLVLNGPSDWQLPAGVTNLYLYDNEDGSLTVSADPISGKKPADPQPVQAIDNMMVTEKAHKVMIDGQLIIVRGDKMFDATGRQL